jgi:nucleoside-diphosphate-sugar epimerase
MIVGRGMIANAFSEYNNRNDIVIFASGVSNSRENDEKEFRRERELLEKTIKDHADKTIVYFGTCSIDDPELCNSLYVQHKKAMESLIQARSQHYYIFRLSQVTGHTQSPTLINFIVNKIENGEIFEIWKKSYRNIIDVEDVFTIADYLIKHKIFENEITNIAAPKMVSIFTIVHLIEMISGKKGQYSETDNGGRYEIDITKITPFLRNINVDFHDKYVQNVIKKYFYPDYNVNIIN